MTPWTVQSMIVASLVAAIGLATPLPASGQRGRQVELDLTDQDYVERRLPVDAGAFGRRYVDFYFAHLSNPQDTRHEMFMCTYGNLCRDDRIEVHLKGRGMIEVGFGLAGLPEGDWPSPLRMRVYQRPARDWEDPHFEGTAYRQVVLSTADEHTWRVFNELDKNHLRALLERFHEDDAKEEAYAFMDRLDAVEWLAVARRVDGYCTMSATVSGDINQHFFGDVAYFNAVEHPVKKGMMVGTIGETQAHEDVEGFGTVDVSQEAALSLAARLGLISEEEEEEAGQELAENEAEQEEEEPTGEAQGFADWMQQELRADDPAEGDNFGLNLVDLKSDVTPKTDEGAGAMFAGAFALALSGRADLSEFFDPPEQVGATAQVSLSTSTVTATVGLGDKDGDRIAFEMIDSNPLRGAFETLNGDPDQIIGWLEGELETKGVYTLEGVASSPRKLKIDLAVTFAARRGSLSCMQ